MAIFAFFTWERNLWPGAKLWSFCFLFLIEKWHWCHCCWSANVIAKYAAWVVPWWKTGEQKEEEMAWYISRWLSWDTFLYVFQEKRRKKENVGFPLWGKVMDSGAFLGINLTLLICVDFKHYFFWHTLNTGSNLAEGRGEGDLRHPFNTGVDIKRHLRCEFLGLQRWAL